MVARGREGGCGMSALMYATWGLMSARWASVRLGSSPIFSSEAMASVGVMLALGGGMVDV